MGGGGIRFIIKSRTSLTTRYSRDTKERTLHWKRLLWGPGRPLRSGADLLFLSKAVRAFCRQPATPHFPWSSSDTKDARNRKNKTARGEFPTLVAFSFCVSVTSEVAQGPSFGGKKLPGCFLAFWVCRQSHGFTSHFLLLPCPGFSGRRQFCISREHQQILYSFLRSTFMVNLELVAGEIQRSTEGKSIPVLIELAQELEELNTHLGLFRSTLTEQDMGKWESSSQDLQELRGYCDILEAV
ncbi:uncharacterized protein LOC111540319 [Piliocolobus tephrosceles]|uniref:uncharacterized protein LOC111540319 n=1 Tax=Piliocolobus tephrosceles TaxID=591936 RepID=UPI000C29C7BA|nr:uncharacterized protein LOC111540319 [Piliocolobus tephrosceles]